MGKTIALLLVFALSLSPALTEVALAQSGPDRFNTMEACEAALLSNAFSYYKPSFLTGHKALSIYEEKRTLEGRACAELHIVGGRSFVPQPAGTEYVFSILTTPPTAVRRWDCGNDVGRIVYVPETTSTPTPLSAPTPTPIQRLVLPSAAPQIVPPVQMPNITNTNINTAPAYKPSSGGNGKWWALGILGAVAAGLCAWKCKGGGGGGVVVNTTTNTFTNPAPTIPVVITPAGPVVTTNPPTGGSSLPICTNPTQTGCVR